MASLCHNFTQQSINYFLQPISALNKFSSSYITIIVTGTVLIYKYYYKVSFESVIIFSVLN
jgi:hypothetical protein